MRVMIDREWGWKYLMLMKHNRECGHLQLHEHAISSTPITWRRTYCAKHQRWSWGGRWCSCETLHSLWCASLHVLFSFSLLTSSYQPCTIHFGYLRGRQDVSEVICWRNARTRVMFSTRYAKSWYFVSQREVKALSHETTLKSREIRTKDTISQS